MEMDLTEISRKQALVDLDVANARIVELSCRIAAASSNLLELRHELSKLEAATVPPAPPTPPARRESLHKSPLKFAAPRRLYSLISLLRGRPSRRFLSSIDNVCGRPLAGTGPQREHTVSRNEFRALTITGWMIPRNFPGAFSLVEVALKGEAGVRRSRAPTTIREDVAAHFSNPSVLRCGFKVEFIMSDIPSGTYTVELLGETPSGEVAGGQVFVLKIH